MQTLISIENTNVLKVTDLYSAYSLGNIDFILDRISPNAHWMSHCEASVPWGGDFTGRVQDFFRAIAENVEVLGFEPGEFIAEGNTVVSMGTFSCRAHSTGKSATTKWIFVWKLDNGMVASYEQFHDPKLAEIFRA